ncbi:hypothetical protein CONLIGDRAFT_676856 [Coniochaeta ligniaria NRRL 30616]|uniref:Uncharacterized protein n=1 Tax=Coniochaeta ligniaria NRRL 30616 TaxID=1408157 RepID=A0A1J7IZ77_9PEZI|nr:hypothetical protein CONLIGDRAFT_676856 [Coniochaeta ligniaria NRRL 30616]
MTNTSEPWSKDGIIGLTTLLVMICLSPIGWLLKRMWEARNAPSAEIHELEGRSISPSGQTSVISFTDESSQQGLPESQNPSNDTLREEERHVGNNLLYPLARTLGDVPFVRGVARP